MNNTYEAIVIKQIFNASAKQVWEAITDLDEMKQWYFDNIPAFEAEVGFETRFTVQVEDRIFPHIWKITEVIPEKKISYDWEFKGYPGSSNVSFELTKLDKKTKLKLIARVLKPFPSDVPEFNRESGVKGWNYFIKESLKSYLEKDK